MFSTRRRLNPSSASAWATPKWSAVSPSRSAKRPSATCLQINTEDVALSPKFPTLPTLTIGKFAVALESISGHGAARATFALKQIAPGGKVTREWAAGSVTRTEMTTFALNLLDIADQMMHDEAYSRSSALNPTEEARA